MMLRSLADTSGLGESSGFAPPGAFASAEPAPPSSNREQIEKEISDLTWAVIDGVASPAERKRLAELVSLQHRSR